MKTRPVAGSGFISHYALMMIVICAIVYGSLYPFVFHDSGALASDFRHLAATWNQVPHSRGDILANILLYMPLGLTTLLAFGDGRSKRFVAAFAVCVGAALSFSIELAQFYDVSRVSVLSDFYLNVTGTLAGVAIAWTAGAVLVRVSWPSGGAPAFARLLLLAWLGWRLYPYVPTIDLHKYWRSLKPLFVTPSLAPYDIFRYAALWLSLFFLFQLGLRPKKSMRLLLPAMLTFFAAKIAIIDQALSLPEILGALLAVLFGPLLLQRYRAFGIPCLAMALVVLVILTRILPWQFAATARAFQWVPFFSFLHGSLQVDVISFAQKFYLYGVVILLLVKAGASLRSAMALECGILLATSVLQIFMVSRTAEITDAVLALVLGCIYALLRRHHPERAGTPLSAGGSSV